MFVNGSGQSEQSLERTFHRCFLPSFTSFGWGVSEEKIKMWKINGRQMTYDRGRTMDSKWWQKLTLPLARWAKNWGVSPSAREDHKQFLLLIRYPLCYIGNTVKSPVKVLVVIEERKNLKWKMEKIHCHLRWGYFVNVNQIVEFLQDDFSLSTT